MPRNRRANAGTAPHRGRAETLDPITASLASNDPGEVERARAVLVARGSSAVPVLLRCLELDGDTLRQRALSLLALLGDPSAAGPVASLLRHPDASLRARAAGTLARIAAPSAVPALARLLAREKEIPVRLATARSLVRLVQTGHDESLRPLFELIADPEEDPRVRTAALEAIPWATVPSDSAPVCALLGRLVQDGQPAVAQKAKRLLASSFRPRLEPWAVERLLRDLRSERLATWRRAVSRLGRAGGAIVDPVLDELERAPHDREFARRAVLVLKGMSSRQLARIGPYLDTWTEPVPLGAIVEVAASAGSRALLARLAALIHRLGEGPEADGPGPLDEVRQASHAALARAGSRLAMDDLHRILADRRYTIRPTLVETVALVGARRELPALLRAYRHSRGVARLALRDAVIAICRREKIRRTEKSLAALEPGDRAAVVEILGAPRRAARRRGIGRIDRVTSPLLT